MKRLNDYIEANVNSIDEDKLYDRYHEMLDCDGTVKAGGLEFYPSNVLKECDPIAYRCGYTDWLDSCRDEYVEFSPDGTEVWYDRREFERAVEDLIDEIESEISDLETERDEDPDHVNGLDTTFDQQIAALQAEITEIKKLTDNL